jgi:hypothetical protein
MTNNDSDDAIGGYKKAFPEGVPTREPLNTIAAGLRARRAAKQQFVMLPWTWKERLAGATQVATYKLAIHLLHRAWKNPGKPIKLSNTALTEEGISRGQKSRALRELQGLGLIEVEKRPFRSPIIRLLR